MEFFCVSCEQFGVSIGHATIKFVHPKVFECDTDVMSLLWLYLNLFITNQYITKVSSRFIRSNVALMIEKHNFP